MSDEQQTEVSDEVLYAAIKAKEPQINSLLLKKDKINALKLALHDPPIATKTNEVKEANAELVEKVIVTISESDIQNIIDSLDSDACDNLMKYIYKFLERSSNCTIMLKLHAYLSDKAGLGSIVRVMTDRKTV